MCLSSKHEDAITKKNPPEKSGQTVEDIKRKHTKESSQNKDFSFTSSNTNLKRSPKDSLAEYLVRCTFAQLKHPSDPVLKTLFNEELVHLSSAEWNRLDLEYRKLFSRHVTWQNYEYFLNCLKNNNNEYLTLVLTMSPNGYVREAAIRQIAKLKPNLNHITLLLLRLNDWNYYVHDTAKTTIISSLPPIKPEALIITIPALVRLKNCDRHLTEDKLKELFVFYRNTIPLHELLAKLDSPYARSIAELLWSTKPLTEQILLSLCSASDPYVKFNTLRMHVPLLDQVSQEKLVLALPKTNWTPAKIERLEILRKLHYQGLAQEWVEGLTDKSQSVRQYCVFYLEKENFNVASHYIDVLKNSDLRHSRYALPGLVEIKSELALPIIQQWLDSGELLKLTTALSLVNDKEASNHEALIIESLRSLVPSLRKAAFIAAQKLAYNLEFEATVWDESLPIKNKQLAAKLTTKAGVWESLLIALKLVKHHDHSIQIIGQLIIESNISKFCNTFSRPDEILRKKILNQLESVEGLITKQQSSEIIAVLSI